MTSKAVVKSIDDLVVEIAGHVYDANNARARYCKHRLAAGQKLVELRTLVEANGDDWWKWWDANQGRFLLLHSRKDCEKLIKLASDDNPELAFEQERERVRVAVARHRERKAAAEVTVTSEAAAVVAKELGISKRTLRAMGGTEKPPKPCNFDPLSEANSASQKFLGVFWMCSPDDRERLRKRMMEGLDDAPPTVGRLRAIRKEIALLGKYYKQHLDEHAAVAREWMEISITFDNATRAISRAGVTRRVRPSRVIAALKRKTVANGCTPQEERSAKAKIREMEAKR